MPRYRGVAALIQEGALLGTQQSFADAAARKAQKVRLAAAGALAAQGAAGAAQTTANQAQGTAGQAQNTANSAQGAAGAAQTTANQANATANDINPHVIRDDGVAPLTPTNVVVTPFIHTLDVEWDEPPGLDYVAYSRITVDPAGAAPAKTTKGGAFSGSVPNLTPNVSHTITVKLVDRWGRQSSASPSQNATPLFTAAESVDLGALEILGRLQGLLPDHRLETIEDATKLANSLINRGHLTDEVIVARHVAAGVITAQAMAVQDAAAFNLWASNAMIQNAHIVNLNVDKLIAGTFSAGDINLLGAGRLKAGRTILNSLGLQIPNDTGFTNPTVDADIKISNTQGTAAMNFYSEAVTSNSHRGMSFRALGNGGTYRGNIVFHSLYSPTTPVSDVRSASLEVRSTHNWQGARVVAYPYVEINGGLEVSTNATMGTLATTGQATIGGTLNGQSAFLAGNLAITGDFNEQVSLFGTAPANGGLTVTHSRGKAASIVAAHVEDGSNGWIPLPTIGSVPVVYVQKNNSTQIRIQNNRTTAQNIRVYAWFS